MQIYYVRHGESEANLLHVFSNNAYQHPLTERGRSQAADLAGRLRGIPFVRLYCSPVLRAHQTAEILGQVLGLAPEVTEALHEFNVGIYEGRSDAAGWEALPAVMHAWRAGDWGARMEGGESYLDIKARFVPFIDRLVSEYRNLPDAKVLLVSHGGLSRALPLVCRNLDLGWVADQPTDYATPIVAELRPEGLVCIEWCGQALDAGWRLS
jgi:broad specificity phosphatase PhoE